MQVGKMGQKCTKEGGSCKFTKARGSCIFWRYHQRYQIKGNLLIELHKVKWTSTKFLYHMTKTCILYSV